MHAISIVASFLLLALSAKALPPVKDTSSNGWVIESLSQSEHKLAYLLSTKDYAALDEVMTQDIIYDATDLGEYGGKTEGLTETVAGLRANGEGAKVEAIVSNLLLLDLISPKKAKTSTYITRSRWVENALDDIKETYRVFYRCEDIWVLEGGAWKLQYSKVYNMGYGVEAPYYGKTGPTNEQD